MFFQYLIVVSLLLNLLPTSGWAQSHDVADSPHRPMVEDSLEATIAKREQEILTAEKDLRALKEKLDTFWEHGWVLIPASLLYLGVFSIASAREWYLKRYSEIYIYPSLGAQKLWFASELGAVASTMGLLVGLANYGGRDKLERDIKKAEAKLDEQKRVLIELRERLPDSRE